MKDMTIYKMLGKLPGIPHEQSLINVTHLT